MPEAETDRVEQAWREAPPADVVRALQELDHYSEEIRDIIEREAARRELRADMTAVLDEANPWCSSPAVKALARTAERLHRPIRRHPLSFAVAAGVAYWVVTLIQTYAYVASGRSSPLTYVMPATLLFVMFLICAPYRRYRTAALVPTIAVAVLMALFAISQVAIPLRGYAADWPPVRVILVALLIPCSALCGIPMVLLLLTTYIRRRFWPHHTPGHCRICDYNLHGLIEPRCPECGTAFTWEEME